MPKLGVNIDHVATVRNARKTVEPDPVWAAAMAELAGADGITVHLREDRRHITDRDVEILKKTVRTKLNLEMSTVQSIVDIALKTLPAQATLVPEKREEITTEGGLDVRANFKRVLDVTSQLKNAGITVSLFIDPELDQIAASREVGADAVELHTGCYAENPTSAEIERIKIALDAGLAAGLEVHAGHGLTYQNVTALAALEGLGEFNIGHSIISRAVFVGLENAVREMKQLILLGGV